MTNVVPDKNARVGKFFFALRVKGGQMGITDVAIKANAIEEGRVD